MATLKRLEAAPTVAQYSETLRARQAERDELVVGAWGLKMSLEGALLVNGRTEPIPFEKVGLDRAAALGRIPIAFFRDCSPALRAYNFNWRVGQVTALDAQVQVVLRGGRVADLRLGTTPLLPHDRIVQAVADATPAGVPQDSLRVLEYSPESPFEVAILSLTLTSTPAAGDTIAFGTHVLSDDLDGIQVLGATHRLLCANGAVSRVWSGDAHRIRRGAADDAGVDHVIERVREFAGLAWNAWSESASGLDRLAKEPLPEETLSQLVASLRGRPYFVSKRAAESVVRAMHDENGGTPPTLYSLWNGITAIGTHVHSVPREQRWRMRLGAGALASPATRICAACRRLIAG